MRMMEEREVQGLEEKRRFFRKVKGLGFMDGADLCAFAAGFFFPFFFTMTGVASSSCRLCLTSYT